MKVKTRYSSCSQNFEYKTTSVMHNEAEIHVLDADLLLGKCRQVHIIKIQKYALLTSCMEYKWNRHSKSRKCAIKSLC